MKKGIKIALGIIVLLFALGILSTKVNAETESVNGLEWTYTVEDGKAVDVYISNGIITDTITVPAQLGEYPVARIGSGKANYNFVNNATSTSVTTIYLPESLEEIGDYAFRSMQYIRTVGLEGNNTTLPNVTRIGNFAFQQCSVLTEIYLPDTLVSIGNCGFQQCSQLKEIDLPNTLTTIGYSAFFGCSGLTSIDIPSSVTSMGNSVFYSCTNLANVTIPDTKMSMGTMIFVNTALSKIPDNLQEITQGMFSNCNNMTEIIIPEHTTNISASAFSGCRNLRSVTIPDTVVSIGDGAFGNNSVLTSINIPDSVITIGNSVFQNCTSLQSINIGSGITKIGNNAFLNIKDVYINKEEGTVEIGDNNSTIHYLNCKHKYNINVCAGIKVINTDTNEEIPNGILEIECGGDFNYKITIDEEVTHDNICYTVSTKPLLAYNYNPSQPNANIESMRYITAETTNSMSNVVRDGSIIVQNIKTGADLVLRKYITKVNGIAIKENRQPVFEFENGERAYKHIKTPVAVNSGDIVRYTIRIYNEGNANGYATEITEYLPEYLEFCNDSSINSKYGWVLQEDGKTIKTNYLSNSNYQARIDAYRGSLTTINYKEVEIECRVLANREEDNKYIASITEITNGDIDSTPGNITMDMLEGYKFEESLNSNSNSYIYGEEDDFDYECILVPTISDISTDYRIRIEKIDALTGEMLNGAKFNLLNEEGEVLKEGVTAVDGVLDFGMMNSVGEGTDTYYIEEVERPEGYSNPVTYKIKVTVTKEIYDYINQKYTLDIKCDIADIDVDISRYDAIPIYTKEQLIKIGSNEEVYIEEVNETFKFDNTMVYKLMQDIDLLDTEWTPLNVENCMLDGNNFAIKNLSIEKELTTATNIGLFGTYSGYIGNLNLENVNITITKLSSNVDHGIGGLVGYMSEGIIKNCNVTGTITSSSENVGGFVGHSEKKKILIFNNSTNSVNITSTNQNIGGLIGCVKGAVNISECTNKGNIIFNRGNSSANSGGLIGCADPDGYESNFAKASYDRENKIITLVVQNDSIIGKYKLKLENVDIQTLKLIEGSAFDILDKDKNVVNGYKGVVLTDGKLDVATIDITTIGTDVYYIKQIATPEGYEVSTNEYVKVIVNKKWDTVNDRYVVDVDTTIINDEDYEIDEVPEDISSSKTGIIHKIMEYKNVTWTTNKVAISDSRNEGNITVTGWNAAGLVARGKTSVEINNCENIGNITTDIGHAGGLLGEITRVNELSYVEIYNSKNKGTISNVKPSSSYDVAGIISYVEQDLVIGNCINEGEINSVQAYTGGIAGTCVGSIKISNSNNAGIITLENGIHASSCAGGIVGKRFSWQSDGNVGKEIYIDNCHNTADINGGAHTGGIIAYPVGDILSITNCSNIGCDVTTGVGTDFNLSGDLGGIVGSAWCNRIYIDNCNVSDGNIHVNNDSGSSSGAVGGIIGYVAKESGGIGVEEIIIKNCNVSNLDIYSVKDVAGIAGSMWSEKLIVENCHVTDTNIENKRQSASSSYNTAAGIVAFIANYDNSSTLDRVSISNCSLTNSNVTSRKDTSGILGCMSGISGQADRAILSITNCEVKDSNIINKRKDDSNNDAYFAAGGILANTWGINKVTLKDNNFSNGTVKCYVEEFKSNSNMDTNAGGIIGLVQLKGNNSELIIDNCDISNAEIENNAKRDSCANTSGIIAGTNDIETVRISDCDVNTLNIHSITGNTAGILAGGNLGSYCKEFYMNSCNVNDTEILSEATFDVWSNNNTGGIIGTINISRYDGITKTSLNNCNLNNSKVFGIGSNIAGILACGGSNQGSEVEFIDCNIISSTISDENMETYNGNGMSRGGISGITYGATYDNCTVKDTEIHAKANSIGGIAGVNLKKSNIENCTVEGVNIYATGVTNKIKELSLNLSFVNDTVGGIIGDIDYYNSTDGEFVVSNCKVKDTNIDSTTDNISGIVGTTNVSMEINDCLVENVDLIQNNENEKIEIFKDYPRSVGGVIAILSNKRPNDYWNGNWQKSVNLDNEITINNPTIKDLDIIVKSGVDDEIQTGGIVGYAMKATIDNANIGGTNEDGTTIKGINIENNTSKGVVGGIAGIAINPYETATEETPEIVITNSTIVNTILKGMHLLEKYVGCSTVSKIDDTNSNTAELITIEQATETEVTE